MGTLKPQSNGQLYSNTAIGTLAVDGWDVTFGTASRGLGGGHVTAHPSALMGGLLHLVQRGGDWEGSCNNPPINGQCTNFILFDVAL